MSRPIYIPSTTPGMTWAISDNKRRGFVGAFACEGKYNPNDGGFESFEFIPFQDRSADFVGHDKRATDKTKAAAIAALTNQLREQGWIA